MPLTAKACAGCGTAIPPTRARQARYCSEDCKRSFNNAKWKAANPDKYAENQRISARGRYAKDPAKALEKSKRWREKNLDSVRSKERERYQVNTFGKKIDDLPYKEAQQVRFASRHSYRSGLEASVSAQLTEAGVPVIYEQDKLSYDIPATPHKYTPDFRIDRDDGSFFYVETKGLFAAEDRKKHLHVKRDNPDVEIRFVFSSSKAKLYKGSPTTYGMWCEKNGFRYADKLIPPAWLAEKLKLKRKYK